MHRLAAGSKRLVYPTTVQSAHRSKTEPPDHKAKSLYAVQGRVSDALFNGKVTQAAWRSKASFYQVSTMDRTIDPDLQRFTAKRMGATTIELPAGHLAIISHPQEIAALILRATGSA